MTLQISPYAQQAVYLPLPNNETPSNIFIVSLSFYDIGLNSYISNYQLIYSTQSSSETVYVNAFVAYPQTVFSYTTNKNVVIYKNEGIFDEKMLGFVNTALVVYTDDKISANQVLSRPNSGVQYIAFYNDDILIFMSSPQGIYFYSTKYNKFYNVYIPTSIKLIYPAVGSVLLLGGYIYFAICMINTSSPKPDIVQVTATYHLLYTKFSYSDLTLSVLVSCGMSALFISSQFTEATVSVSGSVLGNGSYVVLVMLFCASNYVCVKVIAYNINSSTYKIYSKFFGNAILLSYVYFSTQINQQGITLHFNFLYYQQQISIYSYYIFVVVCNRTVGACIISFNFNTGSIENAPIPPIPQVVTLASLYMLRSNIIYIFAGFSSPVQYGNTYYLPVNVYMYQITTSEMLFIEYTQYALEKNTLILSGTVKYLQTGDPVPNATVSVYLYESVQGHSYAVSNLLTQTTTDQNGNFQIVYKFPNSPNDANIIVTASVDPVVMEVVYPKASKPKQSMVTYP